MSQVEMCLLFCFLQCTVCKLMADLSFSVHYQLSTYKNVLIRLYEHN